MDWEVQDFRKKKPIPTWTQWVWPRELVGTYLWRIMFWLILVPTIMFGYILSPVGLLLQLLVIDYFSYLQWKNEQ